MFFTGLKSNHFKAKFSTFLQVEIYCLNNLVSMKLMHWKVEVTMLVERKRKGAFISLSSLAWGNSLITFWTSTCLWAYANTVKIMCVRDGNAILRNHQELLFLHQYVWGNCNYCFDYFLDISLQLIIIHMTIYYYKNTSPQIENNKNHN